MCPQLNTSCLEPKLALSSLPSLPREGPSADSGKRAYNVGSRQMKRGRLEQQPFPPRKVTWWRGERYYYDQDSDLY